MTVKEALIQLDALAADLPADTEQALDDMATCEFILGQVEPRLSGAAFHHLMGRVPRKRAKLAAATAAIRPREDFTFDLDVDLGY